MVALKCHSLLFGGGGGGGLGGGLGGGGGGVGGGGGGYGGGGGGCLGWGFFWGVAAVAATQFRGGSKEEVRPDGVVPSSTRGRARSWIHVRTG